MGFKKGNMKKIQLNTLPNGEEIPSIKILNDLAKMFRNLGSSLPSDIKKMEEKISKRKEDLKIHTEKVNNSILKDEETLQALKQALTAQPMAWSVDNPKPHDGHTKLMAIGKRIKKIREDKNMSQGQLATRAKVSSTTISNLETGARGASDDMISKIAKGLDIKKEQLFN